MLVTKKEISVANINEELWRLSNSFYTAGSPWTETQFAEDFVQENSGYLFLVENGQWLGYIVYHPILDEAEINHAVVNSQEQHQGIGCQLMRAFKEHVKSRDITQILLEVRRSNTLAQKLYEKTGSRKVAVRKSYYKEPQENTFVMCAKPGKEAQRQFLRKNVNYY